MPNSKIIPKVLHFIWIGNGAVDHIETLKKWKALYPSYTINFWIAPKTLSEEEKRALIETNLEKKIFIIRNIEKVKDLKNYLLIMSEIDKGNPWTASDLLRLAILLKEPGFYFDLDITPKKAIPGGVNCELGVLFNIFTEDRVTFLGLEKHLLLHLDVLASAIKNHPALEYMSNVLHANLTSIKKEESAIRDKLLASFETKAAVNYLFASNCTGQSSTMALYNFFDFPKKIIDVKAISFFSVILEQFFTPADASENVEPLFMDTGLFEEFPIPNLVNYYEKHEKYEFLKKQVVDFNKKYFEDNKHLRDEKKPTSLTYRLNQLTAVADSAVGLFPPSALNKDNVPASARMESKAHKPR